MTYRTRVLVVASVTAESDDLLTALRQRTERGPIDVTLLMPATEPGASGRDEARPRLDAALARWREQGFEVTGEVCDADPVEAVAEFWKPGQFDEIVVSTLPGAASRWLQFDVPHRIARLCDAPVTHVVSRPPGYKEHPTGPPPARERAPLGPLSVLTWGGPREAP